MAFDIGCCLNSRLPPPAGDIEICGMHQALYGQKLFISSQGKDINTRKMSACCRPVILRGECARSNMGLHQRKNCGGSVPKVWVYNRQQLNIRVLRDLIIVIGSRFICILIVPEKLCRRRWVRREFI